MNKYAMSSRGSKYNAFHVKDVLHPGADKVHIEMYGILPAKSELDRDIRTMPLSGLCQ